MNTFVTVLSTFGVAHFAYTFGPTVWATSPLHTLTLGAMIIASLLLFWGLVE